MYSTILMMDYDMMMMYGLCFRVMVKSQESLVRGVGGKNLLLPQERKLIEMAKHIEIGLRYDVWYSLYTTSPRRIIV